MRLALADGICFNVGAAGKGAVAAPGQPLVLLHGFTGCAVNWKSHLAVFNDKLPAAAIDLLGHGESDSPPDPARYRMEHCLEDLLAIFDQLQYERVSLLGYSMGGRAALSFAAAHPERVNALILESASPGLADPAERAARAASDEALADRIEQEGLEAFVEYWERIPLFASQSRLPAPIRAALRAQRLRNNPQGLANSLRGLGTGVQPSLWSRLNEVRMPTLVLAGAFDLKFVAIAHAMAGSIPSAQLAIVPDAGHTIHLERPDEFDRLVSNWLLKITGNTISNL